MLLSRSALVLAFGLGIVMGAGAAALLAPSPRAERPPAAEPGSGPLARGASSEGVREVAALAAPGRAAEEPPERGQEQARVAPPSRELIGPALREHARAGFARGWGEVRADELPDAVAAELELEFEREVLALPERLGRREGEIQTVSEERESALALGDGIAWLQRVDGADPALPLLARDPERFAELFRPKSSGSEIGGVTLGERDPLPDGAVISFPAGVFAVADLARNRDPFPKDLTVRGAGMDATLLVMDDVSPRGPLVRFALEDCTVFAQNSIADVRSGPTVLALRRVRVVGFDCGAGGSYALDLRASAISATQCRFEAGYGRNPGGYANLMRRTSPLVARFEGCTFERMSLDGAVQPGAVFSGCAMLDMLDEPGPGPLYDACRITVLPREQRWDESVRRRDLNDLFPGWRERLRAR